MQPASTKLHQLLSSMPYTGRFIFRYIKGEKTEIGREHPRLKLIKNWAVQQIGLKHVSVLFAKFTHGFVFVLLCIYIFNKCPCKNCGWFFPLQKSLVTQGICTKCKRAFSFHSCCMVAELWVKAALCRAMAGTKCQVKQTLYPQ